MIISWNTTNECNLNCKHCYRDSGEKDGGELTTAEAKAMIDAVSRANFKIMIFSGGEPLLRPDLYELLAYATAKNLIAVLGTNGTLIDEDTAHKLKNAGCKGVGISLDSLNKAKHNELRGQNGAWEKAVAGMNACRSAGLKFQIHTTVMDWNESELEDITDFAVRIGAAAHHVFFLIPTGRGENIEKNIISPAKHEEILRRLMEKQKTCPIELKPTCAPQFTRIAAELGVKTRFSRGCLAGLSYAVVNPRGKVQPCAYLMRELGDVRETPFDEIWRDNEIFKELRMQKYKGTCGVCKYQNSCGGCRARAAVYDDNNDIMAADPWCKYSSEFGVRSAEFVNLMPDNARQKKK